MHKKNISEISNPNRLLELGISADNIIASILCNVHIGMCFFYLDETRRFEAIYINDDYFKILECQKTEYSTDIVNMLGATLREDRSSVCEKIISSVEREKEYDYFTYGYTGKNKKCWFRFKGFPIRIKEQVIFLMTISDVSDELVNYDEYLELKSIKKEMLMEQQRYRILAETVEALLFEYDINQDVMVFSYNFPDNKERKIITNYSKTLEKSPMVHAAYVPKFKETLANACEHQVKGSLEYLSEISGHGFQWHRAHYSSIVDDRGKVVSVMGRIYNIDEEVKTRNKYQLDELTGAYIRSAGYDKIKAYREQHPTKDYYIVMMDLDNFKYINDHYGHIVGDEVLKLFVQKSIQIFNQYGLVVRYGGDEVLLFLHEDGITTQGILTKLQGFKEELKNYYEGNLGFSAGISKWEEETLEEVINVADKKMYEEKKRSKKQAVK